MSAWITNTATVLLILPIAIAVVSQVGDSSKKGKFATCLILCVAYSASLGGLATLIGTPPNAIFGSLSESIGGVSISFFDWMLIGVPISVVSLFVLWIYMTTATRLDNKPILKNKDVVIQELKNLGNWTRNEKIVLVIFVATAIAWVTRGLLWKDLAPFVGDHVIAIVAVVVLLMLPSGKKRQRLLDVKTASKIPWGVLLLIGGGLALAGGFTATGLDMWIADKMMFLDGMDYIVIILVIVTITIFASELMSNTAVAALLLPIMAVLGTTTDIDPILLMAPVAFATSYGFMMPVGTPPNAIAIGSGHVSPKQMARFGLPFDLICIPLVTVMMVFLLPLVWAR